MRVTIYMTGKLEMEARFDQKYGRWMARPIERTTKIDPEACGPNSVEALLQTIDRSLSKEMTKLDLLLLLISRCGTNQSLPMWRWQSFWTNYFGSDSSPLAFHRQHRVVFIIIGGHE